MLYDDWEWCGEGDRERDLLAAGHDFEGPPTCTYGAQELTSKFRVVASYSGWTWDSLKSLVYCRLRNLLMKDTCPLSADFS